MNKLILIGNLTGNPECRFVDTANGQQRVCNYTVAVNRIVKGQKTAEYFRISTWNKQADNDMKYLSKGSKVAVTGPVTARAYTSNDGTLRAPMEVSVESIEYLSSGRKEDPAARPQQGQPQQYRADDPAYQDGFMDIPDDIYNAGMPFQ